jgi:cobalt-zinc-cadmium efflux system membrane fusion protein
MAGAVGLGSFGTKSAWNFAGDFGMTSTISVSRLWWIPAVICLGVGTWLGQRWSKTPAAPIDVSQPAEPVLQSEPGGGHVELSGTKLAPANLQIEPVALRGLRRTSVVPGRLQYDDLRHVELKSATDGILTRMLVKPGDRVEEGQVLAWLSSPEVGSARADVLQRRAELDLASKTLEFRSQVADSVDVLIQGIEGRQSMKKLEERFRERMLLSQTLESKVASAAETGAVSSRAVTERTSDREGAEENLKAVCEQSAFDTQREQERARADFEDCQRRHDLARHHLNSLLGYPDPNESTQGEAPDLSQVEMRAPFAGTIEESVYGVSERLKQGDRQFVLADTSRLWVSADLRETDWKALGIHPDTPLTVESPALPGEKFTARVYYVGREVSPVSNAVPLVASLENGEGRLRPGLFVRVAIPLEEETELLAVPERGVMEHERRKFVFVDEGAGRFRRVDVKTGREADGWVEIRSGLKAGDRVVTQGAFLLKSELLLEREEKAHVDSPD